jgi:hypothetical protein
MSGKKGDGGDGLSATAAVGSAVSLSRYSSSTNEYSS